MGATVLVVAGVATRLMRDDLGASLDRRLSSAATSFREGPAGRVADPAQLAAEARRWLAVQAHSEDEVIAVRTASGEVLSTSGGLDLGAVERSDDLLGATDGRWWTVPGPGDGDVRALTVPLVLNGEPRGTLLVATTITNLERTVDKLLSAVAWASGLGLAFAVAVAFVSVRRTLGPLSRMAAEIDAIEPGGELPACLAATVDAPADEVGRVADAFDNLLGRVDGVIASQRRFISDASHELRTPLTVARGNLELVGRLEDPDADRSVRLALEELDRIGSTVEELLLLARLDEGLPLAREAVEVELLLREAALRGMLLGQGDVVVDAPPGLSAIADPDRLLQVVSNLIGNAMRHGGAGVTVALTARPASGRRRPARRGRHRARHRRRRPAPGLRPLLPGDGRPPWRSRRGGPRARHRRLAGRGDGRDDLRGLDARRGHDVLHPPAGRAEPWGRRTAQHRRRPKAPAVR